MSLDRHAHLPSVDSQARQESVASGIPLTADDSSPRGAGLPGDAAGNGPVRVRAAAPHPVWWLIAGSLAVIAIVQISRPGGGPLVNLGNPVLGQTTAGGARGVFAFSGQLTKSTYGVFVVDVDTMTIWTYEYQPQKSCLRLASARTWRYDRYLENHNICDLPPEAVEEMIERQREYRIEKVDGNMPQD